MTPTLAASLWAAKAIGVIAIVLVVAWLIRRRGGPGLVVESRGNFVLGVM